METVEEVVLDETILDDEPDCEFRHLSEPCSVHVTTRAIACNASVNVCDSATALLRKWMSSGIERCEECKRPCGVCWKLWPA